MKMIVVAGPPGAGKSTWAAARCRVGDVILDRDRIWDALSAAGSHRKPPGLYPLVDAAFRAVLDRIAGPAQGQEVRRVFVVTMAPSCAERQEYRDRFGAEIVVLEVGPPECMRRIAADPDHPGGSTAWQPIIGKWWRDYQPDTRDTVYH